MRRLLPHPMLIGWAAGVCLLTEIWFLLMFAITWWLNLDHLFPSTEMGPFLYAELIAGSYRGILIATAVAGALRAACYHPLVRPNYTLWLMSTPWSPEKALPLGPIHLVWQDAAALALLSGFSWAFLGTVPTLIPLVFAIGYTAGALILLFFTKQIVCAYLLLWVAGALVRFGHHPLAFALITGVLFLTATIGLRRSLFTFPWWATQIPNMTLQRDPLVGTATGFLEPVGPKPPGTSWSVAVILLTGAVLAWWAYAVTGCPAVREDWEHEHLDWPMIFLVSGTTAGLIRYILYRARQKPPQSLWGRLLSLRWIIPHYSHLWIAPLLCIAVGILSAGLSIWAILDPPVICGLSVFALTLTALAVGPSYRDWCLTARGHVVVFPGVRRQQAPMRSRN